uniref:Uncharacterized protein n=1 Tax=Anguilla anguilla TaxID=7936 RepID=A0A0E9VMC9_ANGAN
MVQSIQDQSSPAMSRSMLKSSTTPYVVFLPLLLVGAVSCMCSLNPKPCFFSCNCR